MISTTVLQLITERGDTMYGFALNRASGTVRRLAYLAHKENRFLTIDDVLDSLKYMLSRGWLERSGQWGSQKLYHTTDAWPRNRLGTKRN